MREVIIVGTGMTPFGRFLDRSLRQLTQQAVAEALADGGLAAAEIDMIFFGNAAAGLLNGQECVRGQVALRGTELMGKPIVNVENACASSSTAFHLAWLSVASGQSEAALALGAEKMYHEDRLVPLRALEAAADAEELAALKQGLGVPEDEPAGSIFMDIYASVAKRYMERSGATASDLAAVSVKSRAAAALNERAQFRAPVSLDEVLGSRMISAPLTLMMCSPIGDGAAGLVLASADLARRKGLAGVTIKATAMASGRPGDETSGPTAKRAADAAYEAAGLGPEDLDLVELHDAAAPAELTLYEELGLAEPGGGLLSRGHPVGATGCAQLVELAEQLRGRAGKRQVEGARIALAENAGGWLQDDAAASVVTILAA